MLRKLLFSCALAALTATANAGTLAEDAKAFGTRQFVRTLAISPSGKKVVMLVSAAGSATTANVIDLDTAKVSRVSQSDGKPQSLYWCDFAGEQHLVCRFGGADHVGSDLADFSRLLTVRADGTHVQLLGQRESDRARYISTNDGDIIDWLPGQENQVLMERVYIPEVATTGHLISRTAEGLGVDQIDLESLKVRSVEGPSGIDSFMTDGRGNIRVAGMSTSKNNGQLSGIDHFRYRLAGTREWIDLGTFNEDNRDGLFPLAVDGQRNAVFATRRMNGRAALVQVALDGTKAEKVVATNDKVDIDDVVRFGHGQRVIGYTYAVEDRRVTYFDPEFDKLHTSLASAIPDRPSIDFEGSSNDEQTLLIRASSDLNPGTFYVYSRQSHTLKEVAPIRPELVGRTLARVTPVSYAASDSVQVPAYLTLPPGSSGKNLPAIVLPHGGPSARDEWGFDWLPQFLAARGYAVIQPNYRGSDGYGDAWLAKNGFQGWRTSIGDVNAAAHYLVAQGIADPKRLAIVGWSYGGYAALQSAVVEPTLYKAAVAIAPVTDLALTKRESENFTNHEIVVRSIGSGPHIIEGSPLQQASRIKIPVLLVHGDMDTNVPIEQGRKMLGALRSAGASVEMLDFKGLDHQLDDSDARIQMLTSIGALLERTIGH